MPLPLGAMPSPPGQGRSRIDPRRWRWGLIVYFVVGLFAVWAVASDVAIQAQRVDLPAVQRAAGVLGDLLLLATFGLASRFPRAAVAAGVLTMAVSYVAWLMPVGLFALIIVVFVVALHADRRAAALVAVAALVWAVAFVLKEQRGLAVLGWLVPTLVLVSAFGGWSLGTTRRRRDEAERRAADLEVQATQVRQRERQVLARELHDVVAHGLTLISMQATVMRITQDPAHLESARAAIERSSRDSLDELKRLLQVLRASDVITDEAATAVSEPESGVSALVERLAADLRAVGHPVEATCTVGPLAHSVELAADRVLREAVTNIVKHAGAGTRCAIAVQTTERALEITVDNEVLDGHRTDLGSTRLGVVGLTERIELLGGHLEAGLVPRLDSSGGLPGAECWRVRAILPLTG